MNKKCPQCGSLLKHADSISRNICYQCGFSEESVENKNTRLREENVAKPESDVNYFISIGISSVVFVFSVIGIVVGLAEDKRVTQENIKFREAEAHQEYLTQKRIVEQKALEEYEYIRAIEEKRLQMEITNDLLSRRTENYINSMNSSSESLARILNNRVVIGTDSTPQTNMLNQPLRQPIRTWTGNKGCPCPYDQVAHADFSPSLAYANNVRVCGETSSYARSGGRTPSCYSGDPNPSKAWESVMECRVSMPYCYVVN